MARQESYTERVSLWKIQKFVKEIVQGRTVQKVEESPGCLNMLPGSKIYIIFTEDAGGREIREEFVLCEFSCLFNGVKYDVEWINFMARQKEFGFDYIEAYEKHEIKRIEEELEMARLSCRRRRATLVQAISQLKAIAGTAD